MVFQANRYYGAPQQAHNEHAALTNEKRDQEVARHGDIKQAPSKFTQFVRGVKNATSGPLNMLRNLVSTAAVVAPIPSLGKIKAIGNIGKTIASKVKEIKMFGPRLAFQSTGSVARDLAKPLSPAMIKKLQSMQPKSTSQNLKEAFSYPREALGAWPKSNIKTASNHPAAVTFRETGKTPTQVYRETGKFTTGDFHKLGN